MAKNAITSIDTSIKPKSYGKREQRLSNSLKARTTIQLFKTQKPVFKIYPYISASGKMTPVRLTLMLLKDSTTSNTNLASRPVFVSTSLDPKQYETNDNRIVYADSNEEMIQLLKHPQSPYNSAIVSGTFGSANIPFDATKWDNELHNKHALDFISKCNTISNHKNLTDAIRQSSFEQIYAEYLAAEEQLVKDGIVVSNSIIIADESSIVPTVSLNQSVESKNEFFSANKVFGNEDSLATFAPMINKVSGSMRITNETKSGNWTYGLTENNGLTSFSVPVNLFDFRNKIDGHESRIVVRDRFQQSQNSKQRTRSQAMQEFVENNNVISIYDGQLRLGLTELGGLTSTFSIEGDDLTYTKAQITGSDNISDNDIDADMSAEVTLDNSSLDEFILTNDDSFLEALVNGKSETKETDMSDTEFESVGNSISSGF